MSRIEVVIRSWLNAAMKGDHKAASTLLKWVERHLPADTASKEPQRDYAAEVRAKLQDLAERQERERQAPKQLKKASDDAGEDKQ